MKAVDVDLLHNLTVSVKHLTFIPSVRLATVWPVLGFMALRTPGKKTGIDMRAYPTADQTYLMTKSSVILRELCRE